MTDLATLGLRVDSRGFVRAKDDLRQFETQAGRTEKSASSLSKGMKALAGAAAGAFAAISVGATINKAIDMQLKFGSAVKEVSTLLDGNAKQMDGLEKSARALAKTYGGSATGQVQAFYQAISAGASSVEEANRLLDTANKLAIGGITDVATATGILSGVLNTYGKEAISAEQISDALFVGMKTGVTTIGELSSSMGRVLPAAKALGLTFDESVAAVAALTKNSMTTAEAVTSLNAALQGVLKPGESVLKMATDLKIEFNATALQTKGLAQFMDDLVTATGGNVETMAQMFGSAEALKAALLFAGEAGGQFADIMSEMEKKTGATATAFSKMAADDAKRLDIAMASINDGLLTLGATLLTGLVPAIEAAVAITGTLADNADILGIAIGTLALTKIPALIGALASAVTWLGTMEAALIIGAVQAKALAFALNTIPFMAAVAGATALYRIFRTEREAINAIRDGHVALNDALDLYATSKAPSAAAAALEQARAQEVLARATFANLEATYLMLKADSENLSGRALQRRLETLGQLEPKYEQMRATLEGLQRTIAALALGAIDSASAVATVSDATSAVAEQMAALEAATKSLGAVSVTAAAGYNELSTAARMVADGQAAIAKADARVAIQATLDAVRVLSGELGIAGEKAVLFNQTLAAAATDTRFSSITTVLQSIISQLLDATGGVDSMTDAAKLTYGALLSALDAANRIASVDMAGGIWAASNAAAALASNLAAAAAQQATIGRQRALTAARASTVGDPVGRAGAEAVVDFRYNTATDGGYADIASGRGVARIKEMEDAIRSTAEANEKASIAVNAADAAFAKLGATVGGGGGGGGGASKAMKGAAKEAKALAKEIEKLEFDADPLKKYNSELANLNELAANGLSDGAYRKAVEELGKEFANSIPYVDDIANAIGDFVARGFKDFKSLLSAFKDMIRQMIATAIANPIKLAISAAMTGGIPGAAAAGAPGAGPGGGLLSGITGGISTFLSSAFSGASGLVTALGGGLGSATTYLSSVIGSATTSIGAFGAAVGAIALPLAAVAAVFSFFRKKTELLDSGIRVTVDNLDVLVETFEKIKTTRFWGLSKKISENFTEAEAELARPIVNAYLSIRDSVTAMAETLGLGTAALDDFSMSVKISTEGMSQEQALQAVQDELTRLGNGMAERLIGTFEEITREITRTIPNFGGGHIALDQVTETITETIWTMGEFAREGETALDTLTRLSTSLVTVNAMMDTLGHHMFEIGLAGADMASQLADAFGGLDAMNQATGAYYQNFYTEAERIATTTRQTTAAMEKLGLIMPQTRDQYRAMVEAMDLTTEAGRENYAALVSLSGAFDQILPAIGSFTAAIAEMVGSITSDVDGMIADATSAQRASEQAAALWYRTSLTLRAFIADLRGTAGVLISGTQAQAFNQARFQTLLASAVAGDNQAASDLTGAARALLNSSAATARTAVDQARTEARVLADLGLAAGVSDIEGARHDVVAGLLGQQVALLTDVRGYLNGGGVLDPAHITALEGQLGALADAIADAEMINYAFLKERLAVTVDLLATANLPADVRRLIANAQTGVTGHIDFIVRSDLSPDLKWLALTSTSQHIKTIRFAVDNRQWSQAAQDVALGSAGVYLQTVRFLADNAMGAGLTEIALTDASELLKFIRFTAGALPADVRAIVFNDVADLQKRIDFIQGSDLPEIQKRLALADATEFRRVLDVVAGSVVTGAVRDLALADPEGFTRSLNIIAGRVPDERLGALALDAATEFTRTINLQAGKTLDWTTIRLALNTVDDLNRTIRLTADNRLSADEMRVALAGSSEMSRVVNVVMASDASQTAIQLALGNVTRYQVIVGATLESALSDPVKRLVVAQQGDYAAVIEASFSASLSDDQKRILLTQQGVYITRIAAVMSADVTDAQRALLLNANTAATRGITILAAFAENMTDDERNLLGVQINDVTRTINAAVDFNKFGPLDWALFQSTDRSVWTTLAARADLSEITGPMDWRLFTMENAVIERLISGRAGMQKNDTAGARLFWMDDNTVDKVVRGRAGMQKNDPAGSRLFWMDAGDIERNLFGRSALTPSTLDGQRLFWMEDETVDRVIRGRAGMQASEDSAKRMFWMDDNTVDKLVRGRAGMQKSDESGARMFWMNDETVDRVIRGRAGMAQNDPSGSRLFWMDAGTVDRNILGSAGFGSMSADDWRLFGMNNETLTRTIKGAVDLSGLSGQQRSLFDAITGTTTGKITLGGAFVFDPSQSFSVWFGSTITGGIQQPIANLRANLAALADAIRAETESRAVELARQKDIAALQSQLATSAEWRRNVVSSATDLVGQIRALEASTGVDIRYGNKDANIGVNAGGYISYNADSLQYGATADIDRFRAAFYGPDGLESQLASLINKPTSIQSTIDSLRGQITSLGAVPSFAGGGYTGDGARSGGLDGQGGFAAMLHPRETVVDHTKTGFAEMVAEVRAMRESNEKLRQEVASLRDQSRQIGMQQANDTRKSRQILERVEGSGMPTFEVEAPA